MPNYKKILSLMFAAIYLSYFVGTHFFYHTHMVNKGSVTHSHPFSKPHNHTTKQIQLIDEISSYSHTGDVVSIEVCPLVGKVAVFVVPRCQDLLAESVCVASLRAPPTIL